MLEGKCGNLCERACEKQGGVCEEIPSNLSSSTIVHFMRMFQLKTGKI